MRHQHNVQMNSTMNRGFRQQHLAAQRGMEDLNNGYMPNQSKNKNYHALVTGVTQYNNQMGRNPGRGQNNAVDPFAKVNPKARKLIESVERNRHSTADRRTGSTGGSSTQQVDLVGTSSPVNQLNATQQNFFNPNKQDNKPPTVGNWGPQGKPNIQIQIPGAQQSINR